MSNTEITLIDNGKGLVNVARINGIDVPVKLAAPANIGGQIGVNLFVPEFDATVTVGGVSVPVHQIGHVTLEGQSYAVLGVKAVPSFETKPE